MAKGLNRYLTKDTQMVNNMWKDAQDHTSLENCELKQRDTTYTVCWNGWNPEAWQYQMLAKMQNGRNSFAAGKNAKWCGHFGRQFGRVFFGVFWVFPHKFKHSLMFHKAKHMIQQSRTQLPSWLENLCLPKKLAWYCLQKLYS